MNDYREQMTVTSALSLFEMTKDERIIFVSKLIEEIEAGKDPLKIHYQLKIMEKLIELLTDGKSEASKRYKQLVLDEALKHGKQFTFSNAEVEIKEFGTRFDYSGCGDKSLLEQIDLYEAMGKAIKKRQEFLKTVPAEGLLITDPDTGETVKVYPPVKTSVTGVQLTLK